MNVLALEPYYGGSHKAFLEGWQAGSRHDWRMMKLPSRLWKWRMRHSAITFARQLHEDPGDLPDILFASDMLDAATFMALCPPPFRVIPLVLYFHENQLTYPDSRRGEIDYHFAFTNLTSALAAEQVWFNSDYHRRQFLGEMERFLARMPDHRPVDAVSKIAGKSHVYSPGIDAVSHRAYEPQAPLRILWVARWEADKNPDDFFEALRRLRARGVPFELSVLGGAPAENVPVIFSEAHEEFREEIVHWGYVDDRAAYERALNEAHVVVSTAVHEFFGIAVAEAAAAGVVPILPDRLAYPEVFRDAGADRDRFLYDGTVDALVDALAAAAERLEDAAAWQADCHLAARAVSRFTWSNVAPQLDAALASL